MQHPTPSPLPAEMTPILDRFEAQRWDSLEEADIALTDGMRTIERSDLPEPERDLSLATLKVFQCLLALRRVGRLSVEEEATLKEVRKNYSDNTVVTDMIWLVDTGLSITESTYAEAKERADSSLALGLPWIATQLYEHASRNADSRLSH